MRPKKHKYTVFFAIENDGYDGPEPGFQRVTAEDWSAAKERVFDEQNERHEGMVVIVGVVRGWACLEGV